MLELAKEKLYNEGRLQLCKQCKGEFIVLVFHCTANATKGKMLSKHKYHFATNERNVLRKKQVTTFTKLPLADFIQTDLHDLINNCGYQVDDK